jgi:hypothetical protein
MQRQRAKYRDLSATAAKCAAFGQDDVYNDGNSSGNRNSNATTKYEDPSLRSRMTT